MAAAVKSGNMVDLSVATGLMEIARQRMNAAVNELQSISSKRSELAKKRKRCMDDLEDSGKKSKPDG